MVCGDVGNLYPLLAWLYSELLFVSNFSLTFLSKPHYLPSGVFFYTMVSFLFCPSATERFSSLISINNSLSAPWLSNDMSLLPVTCVEVVLLCGFVSFVYSEFPEDRNHISLFIFVTHRGGKQHHFLT